MRQRILVVDDEEGIIYLLKDYLELQGYEVITAGGGLEALDKISREPDLIDYVMLHEYCHFVWPDHQPHFWALVARYMPDWKERRARLRG